jgi:DNA-binding response OmpR family regulator
LKRPRRPLSREHLLQATRIHQVDPTAPRVIQTEHGIGYFFALPVEPF